MKMTENPNLEDMSMSSESMSLAGEFIDSNTKSDVFMVDMERFSHLIDKDINSNSRITRNLSRKGSMRGEKKTNSITTCNERDASILASSPRATLLHGGASMPEKPVIVTVGATDHSSNIIPQLAHHQITINNGNVSSNTTTESGKWSGKRFSFRRSPTTTTVVIDPRRILFFFASLSCMGTILLIYLTLSMSKLNGEDHNSTQ